MPEWTGHLVFFSLWSQTLFQYSQSFYPRFVPPSLIETRVIITIILKYGHPQACTSRHYIPCVRECNSRVYLFHKSVQDINNLGVQDKRPAVMRFRRTHLPTDMHIRSTLKARAPVHYVSSSLRGTLNPILCSSVRHSDLTLDSLQGNRPLVHHKS